MTHNRSVFSREDRDDVRERRQEGADQRGVPDPPLHVSRPPRQLQAPAADRDVAVQGQAQESLLLLGCDVSRAAGHLLG